MFFPNFDRVLNFFGTFPRAHFPNPRAIFRQQRHQFCKIDISTEWRLMVLRRPDAILDMTAKGAWTDLTKPLGMIEKGEVLFDLNVTEIVPVTDLRRVQFVEQHRQFAFARNFFVTAAAFDPQFYFFRYGVINDPTQTILHS